jgi:hypothetical protein
MNSEQIKNRIFDLDNPAECAYSYFEVVNAYPTDGKPWELLTEHKLGDSKRG